MVICCESGRVELHQLLDDEGRSLGWIVMPRDEGIVGSEAGTVLLRRELPLEFLDRGDRVTEMPRGRRACSRWAALH